MKTAYLLAIAGFVVLSASAGVLGAVVTLPDTSTTLTCTATVAAQCSVVALPSSVNFTVNNISARRLSQRGNRDYQQHCPVGRKIIEAVSAGDCVRVYPTHRRQRNVVGN